MRNKIEILEEKCLLLEFKTAIQGEIIEHTRLIGKTRKQIAECRASIRDIDKNLKHLKAGRIIR